MCGSAAWPAAADDGEREEVGGGHERAGHGRHLAQLERRPQVAAVDEVHAVHDAGVDHRLGAAGRDLLGVLEQEADLAGRALLVPQQRRRAQEHRRVAVVPAGVHDAVALGREVHAALLADRQGVDVGPQRDHGRALAQPRQHAGLRRALRRQSELLEALRDPRRRRVLVEARLRMAVQVPPPLHDLRLYAHPHAIRGTRT